MPPIELVVTDLDRTLWAEERIHDRTLAALAELEIRGVPLLVATGRRHRSARAGLVRAGLHLPAVVLDGAMGRDRDGRAFHDATFHAADAEGVLEAFLNAGLEPAVYVDRAGVEVVVGDAPSTHPEHLRYIGAGLARDDLRRVVAREPVYAFAVMGGEGPAVRAAAAAVGDAGQPWVSEGTLLPGTHVSVRPPGVSKWAGVLSWCADQGIDPAHVLAVGDGENDLELLEAARVSCVVSDGCEAALALADHVIGPAEEGGWDAVLHLLGREA
jgi:hydroxymethylpyrimidine pyrophosphatase-like HAD family hydrolase